MSVYTCVYSEPDVSPLVSSVSRTFTIKIARIPYVWNDTKLCDCVLHVQMKLVISYLREKVTKGNVREILKNLSSLDPRFVRYYTVSIGKFLQPFRRLVVSSSSVRRKTLGS